MSSPAGSSGTPVRRPASTPVTPASSRSSRSFLSPPSLRGSGVPRVLGPLSTSLRLRGIYCTPWNTGGPSTRKPVPRLGSSKFVFFSLTYNFTSFLLQVHLQGTPLTLQALHFFSFRSSSALSLTYLLNTCLRSVDGIS